MAQSLTYNAGSGFSAVGTPSFFLNAPFPEPAPPPGVSLSIQPAIIPAIDQGVSNVPVTPSSTANTPQTPAVAAVTSATASSLTGWIATVITDPFNHIVGAVVLALIGWWLYKHVVKKIV
jgi:hypothetical protein